MMGATNASMPLHEQYRRFRLAMIEEGEEENQVDWSAYLAYCENNLNYYMRYSEIFLMPILNERVSLSSSVDDYTIAFVWDFEDISMVFRKHMREIAYLRPNIDSMSLYRLVNSVLMSAGFVNPDRVEAASVMDILELFENEQIPTTTKKKYNALKKMYKGVSKEVKKKNSIISHGLLEKCNMVNEEEALCETASKVQEIYHQRWKTVQKSLDLVNRRSAKSKTKKYANAVISNETIALTMAQLAVSKHCRSIPVENIFSSLHHLEQTVWRRIQNHFGEKCLLVYVTSWHRNSFPEELKIIRWNIRANETIKFLYAVQRDHLLKD